MIKNKKDNRNKAENVGVISQKKEEIRGKNPKEQHKTHTWAKTNKGPYKKIAFMHVNRRKEDEQISLKK